jgi:hypothetical protein
VKNQGNTGRVRGAQQKHYGDEDKANYWLGVDDWCSRRLAFDKLGRMLSTGRKAFG